MPSVSSKGLASSPLPVASVVAVVVVIVAVVVVVVAVAVGADVAVLGADVVFARFCGRASGIAVGTNPSSAWSAVRRGCCDVRFPPNALL